MNKTVVNRKALAYCQQASCSGFLTEGWVTQQGWTVRVPWQLVLTAHCVKREHLSQQLPHPPTCQSARRVHNTYTIFCTHQLSSDKEMGHCSSLLFLQILLMLLYWVTCQLTCWDLKPSHGVLQSVQSFAGNMTGAPSSDRMLFMVRSFCLLPLLTYNLWWS